MKNKRDSFNPNAGPGSYKRDKEFLISSESRNKEAPRFKDAPRESLASKNGNPGPIYNVEKKYKNGVEKVRTPGKPLVKANKSPHKNLPSC
jgi:hypothetical protein